MPPTSNSLHEHDLVRVEDAENGVAWETCKSCVHRTKDEPWTPTYAVVDGQGNGVPMVLENAAEAGEVRA
jgi:hypothetical protein